MHYDIILFKFIPSIYIIINNKTKIYYKQIFKDLSEYIYNYESKIIIFHEIIFILFLILIYYK